MSARRRAGSPLGQSRGGPCTHPPPSSSTAAAPMQHLPPPPAPPLPSLLLQQQRLPFCNAAAAQAAQDWQAQWPPLRWRRTCGQQAGVPTVRALLQPVTTTCTCCAVPGTQPTAGCSAASAVRRCVRRTCRGPTCTARAAQSSCGSPLTRWRRQRAWGVMRSMLPGCSSCTLPQPAEKPCCPVTAGRR